MGNRHVTDGSLDFGQGKDVFHQLCHFGACEIFDLRGKALNRAAQIAKAVGALGAFAFLQILLSVLQTLQLVLFLCKLRLGSFFFGSKLVKVWGDRIFEKCGIGRDEGGDGGKTLEIRGKRRLSARDGGANYQQS